VFQFIKSTLTLILPIKFTFIFRKAYKAYKGLARKGNLLQIFDNKS